MKKEVQISPTVKKNRHKYLFTGIMIAFISALNPFAGFSQCSPPADAGNILGPQKACPGDSKQYKVAAVSGATSYTWTLPAGCTVSGQNPYTSSSRIVIVNFGVTFSYPGDIACQASNACGGSEVSYKTITGNNPTFPGDISGSIVACASSTHSYSVVQAADVNSYNWTIPAGASITGQGTNSVSITFSSGFTYGNVSVKAQNNCGSTIASHLPLRAAPFKPGVIIGALSGVCNSTQTYTIDTVYAASYYTWIGPSGSALISGQGTTSATFSFGPSINGNISVNSSNACGASGARVQLVKGNIVITQQPQTTYACQNDTAFVAVTAPGSGLSYQWRKDGVNLTDDADFSGTQTSTLSILKVDSLNAGNYDVIISSSCASSVTSVSAAVSVDMKPPKPGTIVIPEYACEGTTGVLISVPLNSYNTTGYEWKVLEGATITGGQGTNEITVDFGATTNSGYKIRCWSLNNCGKSTDSSTTWIRRSVSGPVMSGAVPVLVCQGSTINYAINSVLGATSYEWTVTPGITINGVSDTLNLNVTFSPSFSSGDICVTASNKCMTSPPKCNHIIQNVPGLPGVVSGQIYSLCNNTLSYAVVPGTNTSSYNWSAPSGATIASGQGTTSVSVSNGSSASGALCVNGVNVCTSGPARCINVTSGPQTPVTISCSSPSICANQSGVGFSCTPVTGASKYTWAVNTQVGMSIVSGQGTSSISVNFGANSGNVYVTAGNACGNSGTNTYSANISCRTMDENDYASSSIKLEAYPNPAQGKMNVSFKAPEKGLYTITVTNLLGKNVITEAKTVDAGANIVPMDLNNIKKGLYMITLKSAHVVRQMRIVID